MDWDGVLVRFGEIGIKSAPVRSQMLARLERNLLDALVRHKVEGDVRRLGTRLWLVGPDTPRLADVASRTFGVVSVSPCLVAAPTIDAIGHAASRLALAAAPWTTFAMRARREGTHTFSSMDVQVQAGSAVFKAAEAAGRTPRVELTRPDLEIHVDVRQDKAFVFDRSLEGPGGIPAGSQGTVVALLSDEASMLAAWMMMRRGCRVIGLHAGDSGSLPDAAGELVRLGMHPSVEILPICTGKVAKSVLLQAAARVAASYRAQALVTGETLGSTLLAAPLPVLRPMCGLAPREVDAIRSRARLPATEDPVRILDHAARETVESALSMRRTVEP